MTTFLDNIATRILQEFHGNLSNVTVVFPNKRASLFLNRALAEHQTPLWSPHYITISELFRSFSPDIALADHIQLIIELYKVYCEVTESTETLDQFYGWGELMLADFDDIDKHMADAEKIFTLLGDIHELDDIDYLSESQKAELQRFFSNFNPDHNSELKKRFLMLWQRFGDIYNTYREVLKSKGIAYEGMLYRNVIESQSSLSSTSSYVFVGFNYLTPVEQHLIDDLRKEGRAILLQDEEKTDVLPVTYLSSPTNDFQARYVSQWLTPERIAAGRRTAIVLADETLLETVLHCLPSSVEHINVTVGYPLAKAPISSMVRLYSTMLQRKSLTLHNINALLRHPYMPLVSEKSSELHESLNEKSIYYPSESDLALDENLTLFFSPTEDILKRLMWLVELIARSDQLGDDFFHESVFRMYCILERLKEINTDFPLSSSLLNNLLAQIIKTTTIPFHGEPLEGIQIMGVLETRNLDFDHILMLSCNEGFMPAHINDTSFIPYSVRKGYALTTIDNKVSIYRYYFEHLLKRCTDATLVYSSATSDGKMCEMSRFMLQYLAQHPDLVTHRILTPSLTGEETQKDETEKPQQQLMLPWKVTPTALGRYLRCPMQFYYNQILHISDSEESDEEEMDARTFGNIFHKAAELFYRPMMFRSIPKSYFEDILNEKGNVTLLRIIDEAFRIELFNIKESNRKMPKLGGLQVINRQMILTFLRNLIEYDASMAPITILGLEMRVNERIALNDNTLGCDEVFLHGYIDRLDKVVIDGKEYVRVIDYKTGRMTSNTGKIELPTLEDIFIPKFIGKHSDYFLQALLYCCLLDDSQQQNIRKTIGNRALQPALFYPQHMRDDYNAYMYLEKQPILDARKYKEDFMVGVRELISEIINPDIPFEKTEDKSRCKYCAYKFLCDGTNK